MASIKRLHRSLSWDNSESTAKSDLSNLSDIVGESNQTDFIRAASDDEKNLDTSFVEIDAPFQTENCVRAEIDSVESDNNRIIFWVFIDGYRLKTASSMDKFTGLQITPGTEFLWDLNKEIPAMLQRDNSDIIDEMLADQDLFKNDDT